VGIHQNKVISEIQRPGSAADERLAEVLPELLADWGDGTLGRRDRRQLPLAIVHWKP